MEQNQFVKRKRVVRKILSQRGGGRDLGAVPLLGGEDAAGHAAENPVLCVTDQAGHPLSRNYQMQSTPDLISCRR